MMGTSWKCMYIFENLTKGAVLCEPGHHSQYLENPKNFRSRDFRVVYQSSTSGSLDSPSTPTLSSYLIRPNNPTSPNRLVCDYEMCASLIKRDKDGTVFGLERGNSDSARQTAGIQCKACKKKIRLLYMEKDHMRIRLAYWFGHKLKCNALQWVAHFNHLIVTHLVSCNFWFNSHLGRYSWTSIGWNGLSVQTNPVQLHRRRLTLMTLPNVYLHQRHVRWRTIGIQCASVFSEKRKY